MADSSSSCISDFEFIGISIAGLEVSGVVGLAANPTDSTWQSENTVPKAYITAM